MNASMKEEIIGLLFPRRCPVCDEIAAPKGSLICPECRKKLSYVSGPRCMKCGKELTREDGEYCLGCMQHRRSFESGAALLNYNEVSARSMARIKYQNKREYLDFYSREMVQRIGNTFVRWQADALVPVPVHPARKRQRGYNQAEELALRLSRQTRIPLCRELLIRTKKTVPQKELTPQQRLQNLRQAFAVPETAEPEKFPAVILVDDIYTTGSTIEACTRVLKQAGVRKVYYTAICIGGDR